MNNNTLSIWLNPANVENHFDDDTIYGVVLNASDDQTTKSWRIIIL